MNIRGVRGATVVEQDQPDLILQAARELLEALLQANPSMQLEDLSSVFFTLTNDLSAAYPAVAARQMGWGQVPMLCAQEIPVPGGLPRCLRVLLLWNTGLPQSAVQHVYLGVAASLRPDLESGRAAESE